MILHSVSSRCQTKHMHEYDVAAGAAITKTGLALRYGHVCLHNQLATLRDSHDCLNSFTPSGLEVFICPCLMCVP